MSGGIVDTRPVRDWLTGLQQRIVDGLAALDGKPFIHDAWQRPEGGDAAPEAVERGAGGTDVRGGHGRNSSRGGRKRSSWARMARRAAGTPSSRPHRCSNPWMQ